jgi:hypothetical protein
MPEPVIVTFVPEIRAGPDWIERLTGRPEEVDGSLTPKVATPFVFAGIVASEVIVWEAFWIVKPVVTSDAER